jgi:hypothetical protein
MRRKKIYLVATMALLTIVLMSAGCDGEADYVAVDFPIGTKLENFTLPDVNGTEQSLASLKGENGAVLVWVSAQCPVVKSYNERIVQVADELKAKGITLIGINSNKPESVDWIKSTSSEVCYKFPDMIVK